jgi:hypothetical protein
VILVCASGSGLNAQVAAKHVVSPAGFEHISGNTGVGVPFRGASARYQQMYDAVDLQAITGSPSQIMTGIGFRPFSTRSIPARQWDVQLALGHTSVPVAQMSTTFANNFTATPTIVLPYTIVNGQAGQGKSAIRPNDLLWVFPFQTPFTWVAPVGNLCLEWRHRNSVLANTPMDGMDPSFISTTTVGANYGKGCTASGQSGAATCSHSIVGGNFQLALANARANSAALMWLGLQSAEFTVPGWCTPLYVNVLATVTGTTDGTGNWASGSAPAALLNVAPYVEVYTQYAFLDATLGAGIGLSDRGVLCAPAHGAQFVSRVWSLSTTGNGSENATTGTTTPTAALITYFTIP